MNQERRYQAEVAEGKQPWEMTQLEVGTQRVSSWKPSMVFQWTNLESVTKHVKTDKALDKLRKADFALHEKLVAQAVKEGKPVPLSVLRDYAGQQWADDAIAKEIP